MKYMGSKARHAKHILPIILKDRKPDQWYVEPFVGGANVIDKVEGKRIGADSNEYLIAFYEHLQEGSFTSPLVDKETYEKVKANKTEYPKWYVGYLGFLFSFGATFFGGFVGSAVDVVCKGRDRIGEGMRAADKAVKQVDGVLLKCCSYLDLDIPPNSLIYCDPPYAGTSGYKNKDKFSHEQFWQWCRDKRAEGHTIFVSEYNAPDDFICVWEKEVDTLLAKKSQKKATEKLFTL